MEDIKICTLFGELRAKPSKKLYARTEARVEEAILNGYYTFYLGGNQAFDALCHAILVKMDQKYPTFPILAFSCLSTKTKEPVYEYLCMMLDNSSLAISFVKQKKKSELHRAYQYAKEKDMFLIHL